MYDVIIIGAGVIGCSIARELSKYKLRICVLEKEIDIAEGTTKANSAIIHAGYDAKEGTLKATLNVIGNKKFDKLSKELDFPFKRNGSIVACFNKQDICKLKMLKKRGETNGVEGLSILSKVELKNIEPNLTNNIEGALYAPTGGIVCPYEMTVALAENAFENGVKFYFNSKVKHIEKRECYFEVTTEDNCYKSKIIINAAGIFSDEINNMISKNKFNIIPRKGEYCLLDKSIEDMIKCTVFQLPSKMGKGILVTPTVDGNILIGPTAKDEEVKDDLKTTKEGLNEVLSKASETIESIPINKIITSFAGLRAHSSREDFIIEEAEDVKGFINVAGIESPGLSAAPAIADMVEKMVINILHPLKNKNFNPIRKGIPKFREMNYEQRQDIIKKDYRYGNIVCRCELVTEGEIIEAIKRPLGAKTIDGVKRRTRAGMGRCQSGFCTPKIVHIISRELHLNVKDVTKFGRKSNYIIGDDKEI